jgi:hypothetical protein
MKYGSNKLTDNQKEFMEYAEEQGYICEIAYTASEAIDTIMEYINGKKTTGSLQEDIPREYEGSDERIVPQQPKSA